MKILFITQYFYPETFRGNDIAFHWAEQGHDVHVVTGTPNYPHGKFYDGYGWLKRRKEKVDGVNVTRLPIIPRGNSRGMLAINYLSYLLVGCVYILFHALCHRYDRVFVQQLSPVTMSAPAVLFKKLTGAPLYTWVLDLWPESLSAAGGITSKQIIAFFKLFVRLEYRYSDKILISSKSFRESILNFGSYHSKIVYFPQWADIDEGKSIIPDELPAIPDGFRIMFTGVVGEAQGFESIMRAALITKENIKIKWIVVGDGRKLDWVKRYVKEHGLDETVFTLGRYPVDTMPWFFNQADLMLVSLGCSPLYKLYAPAKLLSYMGAGKPIIGVLEGEGADIINEAKCGWVVPPGSANALSELVLDLYNNDRKLLITAGKNSRSFYETHYKKESRLELLDNILGIV